MWNILLKNKFLLFLTLFASFQSLADELVSDGCPEGMSLVDGECVRIVYTKETSLDFESIGIESSVLKPQMSYFKGKPIISFKCDAKKMSKDELERCFLGETIVPKIDPVSLNIPTTKNLMNSGEAFQAIIRHSNPNTKELVICFGVDISGSMNDKRDRVYKESQKLLADTEAMFPDGIIASVNLYSDYVERKFTNGDFRSAINVVGDISIPTYGGTENETGSVQDCINAISNVPQLESQSRKIVILTDEPKGEVSGLIDQLNAAKKLGIEVFVLDVGNNLIYQPNFVLSEFIDGLGKDSLTEFALKYPEIDLSVSENYLFEPKKEFSIASVPFAAEHFLLKNRKSKETLIYKRDLNGSYIQEGKLNGSPYSISSDGNVVVYLDTKTKNTVFLKRDQSEIKAIKRGAIVSADVSNDGQKIVVLGNKAELLIVDTGTQLKQVLRLSELPLSKPKFLEGEQKIIYLAEQSISESIWKILEEKIEIQSQSTFKKQDGWSSLKVQLHHDEIDLIESGSSVQLSFETLHGQPVMVAGKFFTFEKVSLDISFDAQLLKESLKTDLRGPYANLFSNHWDTNILNDIINSSSGLNSVSYNALIEWTANNKNKKWEKTGYLFTTRKSAKTLTLSKDKKHLYLILEDGLMKEFLVSAQKVEGAAQ